MLGRRKGRRRTSRSSCPGVVYQSRLCLGGLGAFPPARLQQAAAVPSLQLGSGTRTCWFWEAPRGHSRYSRNDLRKEEQPGQQNTCSAAQTLWGGRKMLPSGVRACRPGQGNCAASTGDFLCQMSSGPEVRAKVLIFGIFCLLELLTTLTETEIPFSHVPPGEYPASTPGRCSWLEGVAAPVGIDFSSLHSCLCNAWACSAMQNLHFAQ